MLTGELKGKIDRVWDAFWTGGISNPLEVIEQITYLLFLRRLDDLETVEESKARRPGTPMERRIFPEGADPKGRSFQDLRWSRFKNFEANEMYKVVDQHVFPFLRELGGDGSTYSHHMRDARLTIPKSLLARVVELQRKFVNLVKHGDSLRAVNSKHLSELDALFASLQHRVFRGEL